MNDRALPDLNGAAQDNRDDTLAPLPGEPGIPSVAARTRTPMSKKGLFAVALLTVSLVAVSAVSIQRFAASGKKLDDADSGRAGDRPAAATTEPRRLDMVPAPAASAAPRIPALIPTAEESADPIGVRHSGQGAPISKSVLPEDAPVLLVSSRPAATGSKATQGTRRLDPAVAGATADDPAISNDALADTGRHLESYQRQLQGLLDTLTRSAAAGSSQASVPMGMPFGSMPSSKRPEPSPALPLSGGLFGGQLQGSATPRVAATMLSHQSLTLPKGTAFTCALKTRVVSAASGFVGCQVQRNVYSNDGRVLLIERGSHMDGEYRITSVRPGTVRIPVLWVRIRMPNGVTVDIDSPGTGPLGESGIDGYVDNRWTERIGAALLLSVIDDSVKLVIPNRSENNASATVVLPSTTSNTSKLAEKVLDSTINISPLIYQNQGGIVGIYVARDVDFSTVYDLKAVPR